MSTLPLLESPGAIDASAASYPGPLLGRWRAVQARITGRFGYALADQVVYSFGNMVVAAIISRHCVQRQFGIYILTQRTMDVLIQISNVLLWAPFTFYLPGTPQNKRSAYQGSILSLQILVCILFTLLLWIASRWASTATRAEFFETFRPLIATAGGILFREFTRRMYFAQMRFQEAFWTDVATVTLQIVATCWLWRSNELDLPHVLGGLCAGATLVSVWWLLREWRTLHVNAVQSWYDLRKNLQLGRWFLGSNMISLAGAQCNPWVLSAVLGGASVGAYAVCESVVNIPRVAFNSMQNVMGPMLARAEVESGKAGVRAAVKRLDRTLFLCSTAACVVLWAVGPVVGRLIFKTPVTHARTILLLLSLNLVAYSSTLAQSYGLTALGRVDTTFIANGLGLLAQAAVCLFLIRTFHVPGAAGAMLVGSVVVLAARQVFFTRAVQTA